MKFKISGMHQDTGDDIQMTIDARDDRAAKKWAEQNAIKCSSIVPQLPPTVAQSKPHQQEEASYTLLADRIIWLIALIAVLLLLMVQWHAGFFDTDPLAAVLGATIAYLVFVPLFGFIGAWGYRKKRGSPRKGFAVGAFILVGIMAYSEGGRLSKSTIGPRESADIEVVRVEIHGIFAGQNKIVEMFQGRLGQIVGDGLIQPSKLDSAEKIAVVRSKLTQMGQLIEERQKEFDLMFDNIPKRIRALPASATTKEYAVQACQENMQQIRNFVRRFTAADRQFVSESQSLADFMESRLGHFRVEGTTAYFDNDVDAARYNAIAERIRQGIAQEHEMAQQMVAITHQLLDRFDSLFEPK